MNSLTQKVLLTSKGCSNFYDAYSNWFDKKVEDASDAYNYMIQAIDNPDIYKLAGRAQNVSIFVDGHVTSLKEVCENLSENDFEYKVNGNNRTLQLVDSMKSSIQSNVLFSKICKILANEDSTSNIVQQFCLQTDGLDLSESACNMRQMIIDVISNERLDKAGKLYNLIESLNVKTSATDGVSDIFASDLFIATGTHPAILWAIETFDLDYEVLASRVAQTMVSAALAVGQFVQTVVETIVNAVDWVRGKFQTYIMEGGAIYSKNEYSFSHFDNTCAEIFTQFRFPTTNVGKNALATGMGVSRSIVDSLYSLCNNKPLIKFDTPFAAIYVGHYNGALGDTLIARFYPKCIPHSDWNKLGIFDYDANYISTVDELVSLWSGYSGSNTPGSNANSDNRNFFEAFRQGRWMLNIWSTVFAKSYLNEPLTLGDLFNVTAYKKNIPSDPSSYTNANVFSWAHAIADDNGAAYTPSSALAYQDGVYILNGGSVNNYAYTIIRALLIYAHIANGNEGFAPYTVENSFYPSTFNLLCDASMAQQFGSMVKIVGYVAIAIAVIAVVAKISHNIKVAYQASEAAYWAAINSGDATSAARFSRKSKFLAMLSGAGSVTSSGTVSVLTSLLNSQNTIIRLIAGK